MFRNSVSSQDFYINIRKFMEMEELEVLERAKDLKRMIIVCLKIVN